MRFSGELGLFWFGLGFFSFLRRCFCLGVLAFFFSLVGWFGFGLVCLFCGVFFLLVGFGLGLLRFVLVCFSASIFSEN